MPHERPAVLLVRVTDVLDRSKAGKQAADELRARFIEARTKREAITDAVEGARFELDVARDLEGARARRRDQLLQQARAAAEKIRKKRGAHVVVDAGAVLASSTDLDITDEIIAAIDRT